MKRSSLALLFFFLIPGLANAKKPAEPIKFKADKMEYVFKKGKEKVTCRGRARMERSDFFLKARLIHIIGPNKDFAKAYNNIKMVNKNDNVVIYGDYAEYDNIEGYAKVFKSPKLVYTNEKLEIESAVMETFLNENKSIARGDVKITQTNYVAYSEKAVYFHKKKTIELTGSPVVYRGKNVFRARKMIVFTDSNLIKLYDEVRTKIYPKKKEKIKKEEVKIKKDEKK